MPVSGAVEFEGECAMNMIRFAVCAAAVGFALTARAEVSEETVNGVLNKIGYQTSFKLNLDNTSYQTIWYSKSSSEGGSGYAAAAAAEHAKLVVVVSGCKNIWWWETKFWDGWSQIANISYSGFVNTITKEQCVYNSSGTLMTSGNVTSTGTYYFLLDAPKLNGGLRGQLGEWTTVEGIYIAVPNGVRDWYVAVPGAPSSLTFGETSPNLKAYLVDRVTKETNTTDRLTLSLHSDYGNVVLSANAETEDPLDFTIRARTTSSGTPVRAILSVEGGGVYTNRFTVSVPKPADASRYVEFKSMTPGVKIGSAWWAEMSAEQLEPLRRALTHAPFAMKLTYTTPAVWSSTTIAINTSGYPRYNLYGGGNLSAGTREETIYFSNSYEDFTRLCFSMASGITIDKITIYRRFVPFQLSVR